MGWRLVRAIEVTIRDVDGHEMTEWDLVQCIIMPGNAPVRRPLRLTGPWLRCKLYTATALDNTNRLFIQEKKRGFTRRPQQSIKDSQGHTPPVLLRPLGTFIPGLVVPAGGRASRDRSFGGHGRYSDVKSKLHFLVSLEFRSKVDLSLFLSFLFQSKRNISYIKCTSPFE